MPGRFTGPEGRKYENAKTFFFWSYWSYCTFTPVSVFMVSQSQ